MKVSLKARNIPKLAAVFAFTNAVYDGFLDWKDD